MLTSVQKYVKILADSGIRTNHLRLPTLVTPDTCIIQDTDDSADLNCARHGQFQDKKKNADY